MSQQRLMHILNIHAPEHASNYYMKKFNFLWQKTRTHSPALKKKKSEKKTGRTREAMKWKSIKQIELIPVVVRCCKWDTLVAFLSVVFTLCRLINTIHPHPYRMATVYMSAHSKFTWLKTSKVRWNFSQPLSGVGGEREKNMNAGASKSNIIYSRYGSSVYFMAKRYR